MKRILMKKGSALLIVLGMLSFMVVSAVSFAIYMRQSRAPSSYLRRNLSSRHLLRAALAKAIDQLEGDYERSWNASRMYGVYDDPYPGCSTEASTILNDGNFWAGRVFLPFGPIDPDETVATLTLEGLAYLPPAIANDVRALSRCSRTAKWRSLPYESGRYAYTAVNVSDCLDLNKVAISANRDSSATGRVSLYPLFDDSGVANGVESVVEQALNADQPLVSLADFSILASSKYSPFQKYIGQQGASFAEQGDRFVEGAYFITDTWCPPSNTVGQATGSKQTRFGLAEGQPWRLPQSMSHWSMCWEEAYASGGEFAKFLAGRLGGVGMACLYDYLDEDSVPVSLSIPTTEVTPMIVGLGSTLLNSGTLKPTVAKGEEYETGHAATGEVVGEGLEQKKKWRKRKITQYSLKLSGEAMANGIVVFPFKRTISATSRQPASTSGQVLTRVYLAEASGNPKCRVANASPLYPDENLWAQQKTYADGIYTMRGEISAGDISFGEVKKMSDAVKMFTTSSVDIPSDAVPVYYQVEEYEGLGKTEEDIVWETTPKKTYKSLDGLKDKWPKFYNADGEIHATWKSMNGSAAAEMPDKKDAPPSEAGPTEAQFGELNLEFNIAMWAKLTQGGKAVDLCPAKPLDDKVWLQKEADLCSNDGDVVKASGSNTPLLNFHADSLQFKLSEMTEKLNGSTPADCTKWKYLVAVDPRFNWAPEDWVANPDSSMNATDWLSFIGADKSGSPVFGWGNDRDTDIFFFVSNQEYLQSIGELAFLPAVQPGIGARTIGELSSALKTPWDGEIAKGGYTGEGFNSRIVEKGSLTRAVMEQKLVNGWCMWKTYSAFDPDLSNNPNGNGQDHDYIYQLGDSNRGFTEILPELSNAFCLTPYADENILMAAFKDTPYDYYIASTNTRVNWKSTSASARLDHVFASDSSYAKMADETFVNIAADFYEAMHKRENVQKIANGQWNWQRCFDSLPWYEEANKTSEADMMRFFDVAQSEPLHGVDRKFLYAFWRECFANRQQLYLIFLRAEPAVVGGGGSGSHTVSQLGGRAVALVWRDPNPPAFQANQRKKRSELTNAANCRENFETVPPHRTRVLFYHVFE